MNTEADMTDQPEDMQDVLISERESESSLVIVGVGASAGGLEALQAVFTNMPDDIDMAFVVAQHLSPSYKSLMVDLLSKDSTIPILTPTHKQSIQPGYVYICPPNKNITVDEFDQIVLSDVDQERHFPRPSVDMLFESIAQVKGDQAVGVILSGTGSDGTRGIRAIKAENGFALIQDPNTAKYDGMPRSAIDSGSVDIIVHPENLGTELRNLLSFPRHKIDKTSIVVPTEIYRSILRTLKRHCKVDFGLYKETTILRRIERRMTALRILTVEEYLQHLKGDETEAAMLFNDMLIGVTSFFRDPKAYEVVKEQLADYIENRESKHLRLWVVGCSTGEEAYSVAMLLADILGENLHEYKIQIFATDIDKKALSIARMGRYLPGSLQHLPREYMTRFFTANDDQFEVIKAIKSMVIFSVHDVTNDPPFLKLDFVSCRNLMIYFTLELQRQIFPIFHYSLNSKGVLFLGQSESTGVFQEYFRPLSRSAKVYQSVFLGRKIAPKRKMPDRSEKVPIVIEDPDRPKRKESHADRLEGLIYQQMQKSFLQNVVLINENYDLIFTKGNNPLLVRSEGIPSNSIYKNLHQAFIIDLRTALHQIDEGEEMVRTSFQTVVLNNQSRMCRLIVTDLSNIQGYGRLFMIFTQVEDPADMPALKVDRGDQTDRIMYEQELQLKKTKEQLQAVIEELETSNEEMQAMNEELQSSNEELQSSNEELETTNEELQSTNEELQTAYAELRMAYEDKETQRYELIKLKGELEHTNRLLKDAERMGGMGSWLWSLNNKSVSWSPGCYDIFGLDEEHFTPSYEAFIGIAHPDDRTRLEKHLADLLSNTAKQPFVFKALDRNKRVIMVSMESVVSYNDLKQPEKVMGTITNISERIALQKEKTVYKEKVNYLLNNEISGNYIFSVEDFSFSFINPVFSEVLGYSLEDIVKLNRDEVMALVHPDDRADFEARYINLTDSLNTKLPPFQYRFKHSVSGDYITLITNEVPFEVNESEGSISKVFGSLFAWNEQGNDRL